MKTLTLSLLILASSAQAQTKIQTQDIGGSTIAFSGANTHSGSETYSNRVSISSEVILNAGGFISANSESSPNTLNTGIGIAALNISGITLSSGCIVNVMAPNGGGITDQITFTTSTAGRFGHVTAPIGNIGVLTTPSCTNNSICYVGIHGIYRVQADGSPISANNAIAFGITACRATDQGLWNENAFGRPLQNGAVSANAFFWVKLE